MSLVLGSSSLWAVAATEKERKRLTEKQWRLRWVAELTLFETLPFSDSHSTSSEPSALIRLRLLLLLLLVLRIRTLSNQSEERRRTCSRWLSSYLTGELATTWPRLTGMKSLMKSPKSISTRMEDMARHGELLIKMVWLITRIIKVLDFLLFCFSFRIQVSVLYFSLYCESEKHKC